MGTPHNPNRHHNPNREERVVPIRRTATTRPVPPHSHAESESALPAACLPCSFFALPKRLTHDESDLYRYSGFSSSLAVHVSCCVCLLCRGKSENPPLVPGVARHSSNMRDGKAKGTHLSSHLNGSSARSPSVSISASGRVHLSPWRPLSDQRTAATAPHCSYQVSSPTHTRMNQE